MKTEDFQGFEILYGTSSRDNDQVSTAHTDPFDFWFHASGYAGSHVVVKNPDRLPNLPKDVEKRAAEIAVLHSKAKDARGKIEVHLAWGRDVKKPKGYPPGKVIVKNHRTVKVYSPA